MTATAAPAAASSTLTPAEMVRIFDETPLPGTVGPGAPPAITGNAAADARIRAIAEGRGYRLRPVATGPFAYVNGHPVHPTVAQAWNQMTAAAGRDGISMWVVSGYRSVEAQRSIFLGRISGWSTTAIANGSADGAIDAALRWVSIPGYSKHHTGYAVDLGAPGGSLGGFAGTAAFRWLSADNYANAKRFGFLPSYPAGAGPMGPEPEPWEYVYVGTEAIRPTAPFGHLDLLTATAGQLRMSGWAIDPDDLTAPIGVHAYAATGQGQVFLGGMVAALDRPDVATAIPGAGPRHGFDLVVPTDLHGPVTVCVHALNIGPGTNRAIGCASATLPDRRPLGHLDVVQGGPGQVRLAGWTFDPDAPTAPLGVHAYLLTPSGGTFLAGFPADRPRGDVAHAFPAAGANHGFDVTVLAPRGAATVCTWALNVGPGSHRTLGCVAVAVG